MCWAGILPRSQIPAFGRWRQVFISCIKQHMDMVVLTCKPSTSRGKGPQVQGQACSVWWVTGQCYVVGLCLKTKQNQKKIVWGVFQPSLSLISETHSREENLLSAPSRGHCHIHDDMCTHNKNTYKKKVCYVAERITWKSWMLWSESAESCVFLAWAVALPHGVWDSLVPCRFPNMSGFCPPVHISGVGKLCQSVQAVTFISIQEEVEVWK